MTRFDTTYRAGSRDMSRNISFDDSGSLQSSFDESMAFTTRHYTGNTHSISKKGSFLSAFVENARKVIKKNSMGKSVHFSRGNEDMRDFHSDTNSSYSMDSDSRNDNYIGHDKSDDDYSNEEDHYSRFDTAYESKYVSASEDESTLYGVETIADGSIAYTMRKDDISQELDQRILLDDADISVYDDNETLVQVNEKYFQNREFIDDETQDDYIRDRQGDHASCKDDSTCETFLKIDEKVLKVEDDLFSQVGSYLQSFSYRNLPDRLPKSSFGPKDINLSMRPDVFIGSDENSVASDDISDVAYRAWVVGGPIKNKFLETRRRNDIEVFNAICESKNRDKISKENDIVKENGTRNLPGIWGPGRFRKQMSSGRGRDEGRWTYEI